jgi:hypothetical protein
LTLKALGDIREIYLFDTFDGMPEPTASDVDVRGAPAAIQFNAERNERGGSAWCAARLEDVRQAMTLTGYPMERVHFVKGKVEDTLPDSAPSQIALLRLDTDWYESTRHELVHLFPRLERRGVLILDDYGHWQGARQAVDEYLGQLEPALMLTRTDYTGRVALKV